MCSIFWTVVDFPKTGFIRTLSWSETFIITMLRPPFSSCSNVRNVFGFQLHITISNAVHRENHQLLHSARAKLELRGLIVTIPGWTEGDVHADLDICKRPDGVVTGIAHSTKSIFSDSGIKKKRKLKF